MIQNTSDAVQWKDENFEFKQRTMSDNYVHFVISYIFI